jgi:hypothetical protein
MRILRFLRVIVVFGVAAAVATVLASVLQTQFNLAALQALGAEVPFGVRLDATLADLAGFPPTFGPLVLAAFLVAFLVTALLRRWVTARRTALYALAGAVAVLAMILIMQAVFGLQPIAAARGLFGFASLLLAGAAGGAVFARGTAPG